MNFLKLIKQIFFLLLILLGTQTTKAQVADKAWGLWKNKKWGELEDLFKSNKINFDARRNVYWPPNRGFIDFVEEPLTIGKEIDRYGGYFDNGIFKDGGNFVSPKGASFGSRALPVKTLDEPYRKYRVIKEIPGVKKGTSAPWFDQPKQANEFIQNTLIPEMRQLIDQADQSIYNLNEYFKQVINPNIGTLLTE